MSNVYYGFLMRKVAVFILKTFNDLTKLHSITMIFRSTIYMNFNRNSLPIKKDQD